MIRPTRRRSLLAMVASLACTAVVGVGGAGANGSHALIQGSGSSWAANAVNQWVADVNSQGIQVVYTPNGDAQGRQDFATRTADLSVTSLGYQGVDPVTGVPDTSQGRQYAYLPIAAGGTAFPYHITIRGQQVRNLRLSGETLAKIFTNVITNWNDPQITADNNGHALPSLPIIPVVQSEGSGATAQLTRYFATRYGAIWSSFSHLSGLTEYYPRQGNQIAQNGSNGAMNYVASSSANGSIGYVEYSFALSANYPVVKVLNQAGYFSLPTQYNDAVALEAAQINNDPNSPNYLLQNLDNVYTNPDPRTYPLSSYVYAIEPIGTYPSPESRITTAKRQSIADFLYYSICQGQREIGPIGYSPLPVNLVEAGFGQINKLKAADPSIDLAGENINTCGNPTFVPSHPDQNYLAQIAPMPLACAQIGADPCAAGRGDPESLAGYSGQPVARGGAGGGASGSAKGTTSAKSLKGRWHIDKATGQLVPPNGIKDGILSTPELGVTTLGSYGIYAGLVLVALMAAIFLPPAISRRRARGRTSGADPIDEGEGA